MCSIAGFSGDFVPDLLERMNAVQAHRGPDGRGILHRPTMRVGLAHGRLAIIDLSQGAAQPMWDVTGRAAIAYNGELYNYRELRADLLADGYRFRTQSDTEVLLNLYLREGPAMLSRLNGIFAFAIWDEPQRHLFLARDGMGVKPLYFASYKRGFLFASEIKALLEEETLSRDLDPEAIRSYVTYLWCPAPRTPLASVAKLEPGHALIVSNGEVVRRWVFYDLPYDQPVRHISTNDAILELRAHLQEAVRRQLVADVQVGAFLSGGLDSSSLVAMAVRALGEPQVPCFTIEVEGGLDPRQGVVEDLPYARRVASHLGVPLHVISVNLDIVDELRNVIYHLDEPQADLAPINAMLIARLARRNGIKVLLSGAGGDDVFTGYRRHFALIQERLWAWLPRPFRKLLRVLSHRLPKNTFVGRRVARAFQFADLDENERLVAYFRWLDAHVADSLLGPALRNNLTESFADPLLLSLARLPASTPPLNRMLYLEAKHFLADHNLNYVDKASMSAGVEVRVPFLDPDLVQFAATLPLSYKQRRLEGKWILKKAMEPDLPADVIRRPKTGFGLPLRQWLEGDLRPVVEELLSEHSLRERGLFDAAGVRRALKLHQRGEVDLAYPILSLVCIELWCREFLDGARPSPPPTRQPAPAAH